MLDLHRLQQDFEGFSAYQAQEQALLAGKLARALDALCEAARDWEALRAAAQAGDPGWLMADLREVPTACCPPGARPTPVTVVAADGSQVYPDRHVEPSCYLLNVSRIAFQYGTTEAPVMEAVPAFRYRRDDLDALGDDLLEEKATAEVVSALRDELELKALLDAAAEARRPGRPILALADGTLIRWMLRGMRNRALEDRLIASYARTLDGFAEAAIPLCAYLSMPGNTEVVNLLRFHQGERRAAPHPYETSLAGLVDRWLFERLLAPGERSAVFASTSHIQQDYAPASRICYFYVHACDRHGAAEIARVEMPLWVAERPDLVELVHAVVLSECEKGDGYPLILSEAHERAVVRARERELFYRLIDEQMHRAGLRHTGSRKQASKRRPSV